MKPVDDYKRKNIDKVAQLGIAEMFTKAHVGGLEAADDHHDK